MIRELIGIHDTAVVAMNGAAIHEQLAATMRPYVANVIDSNACPFSAISPNPPQPPASLLARSGSST